MSKPEVFISVDIEADGPIPGPHSMLSIGASAFRSNDLSATGKFVANLELLPGAIGHPDTMAWWKTQPEAYMRCRANQQDPGAAMNYFVRWVELLGDKPVFVGYPASYDFMFVYWYLIRFVGRSPFSHSALDIKTLAMTMLGTGYRESTKKAMPKRWFEGCQPHTHESGDDAHEQGVLLCNMLRELRSRKAAE